ncbi:hypothetical protein [Flavobacterium sp.]|uniref:hypothetical protein n=1 Tax=Flavobacterium sp. TaxID=239 RepID=UPI003D09B95B
METIKIAFQPDIKDKLLALLQVFSKNELQIIEEDNQVNEDSSFLEYRNKLHKEVEDIKSGKSKLYDIDELDAMLEKTISKHED